MKRKVFAWIMVLILALAAVPALADGNDAGDALEIDATHVYPDMDKSYEAGYMPKSGQKDMRILLPLVGSVEDDVIHVSLELPKDNTFDSDDLVFDVAAQSFDVKNASGQTESVVAFLIDRTVPVSASRVNGTHIVRAVVSYRTKTGETVEQTFHVQTKVTNGKNANGNSWDSPTVKNKPLILVHDCRITPDELFGGDRTSIRLFMINTGDLAAKNIRISLDPESDALVLPGDRNAQFFDALPVNAAFETSFDLEAAIGAAEGPASVTVKLAYEDKYGGEYTGESTYTVRILQPKVWITVCEYPEVVNGGDSFTVALIVTNTGERDAKDVAVQFAAGDDSIRCKGTLDHREIESLKKGESTTVTFDLRALPSASEGKHKFRFD